MTTKFIIIKETALQSIVKDAVTLSLGIAIFVPGYVTGIPAMQWTGAIVFFLSLLSRCRGERTFTFSEARAEIDRLELLTQKKETSL